MCRKKNKIVLVLAISFFFCNKIRQCRLPAPGAAPGLLNLVLVTGHTVRSVMHLWSTTTPFGYLANALPKREGERGREREIRTKGVLRPISWWWQGKKQKKKEVCNLLPIRLWQCWHSRVSVTTIICDLTLINFSCTCMYVCEKREKERAELLMTCITWARSMGIFSLAGVPEGFPSSADFERFVFLCGQCFFLLLYFWKMGPGLLRGTKEATTPKPLGHQFAFSTTQSRSC